MSARFSRALIATFASFLVLGAVGQALASEVAQSQIPYTPQGWPTAYGDSTTSTPVTNGVTHIAHQFSTLGGPLVANVLAVNLNNPNVKLGVVLANNQVYSNDETLTSMANRTGAVGGINGDFFEMGNSGRPENLVMSNGQVLQSQLPGGYVVVGVTKSGQVTIGPQTFTGSATVTSSVYSQSPTVQSGGTRASAGQNTTVTQSTYGTSSGASTGTTSGIGSFPIGAVNRPGLATSTQLGLITPAMGSLVYVKSDSVAYLAPVVGKPQTFTVAGIQIGVKAIPALVNQDALIGGRGPASDWIRNSLSVGDTITLTEGLTPGKNIVQAVGAGYQLLKNGKWYNDPHALGTFAVNEHNPLTAIGVTRNGTRAFLVVFDGPPAGASIGLTYPQMANYLRSLGAYNAAMFDGGGSSEMVARQPGQNGVSVVSTPSYGQQRQVADGLFVFSTEAKPGPIKSIVVNDGNPVDMMVGASTAMPFYALDANGNPPQGANGVTFSVVPSTLASVQENHITALRSGNGKVVATAKDGAKSTIPIAIVAKPTSVRIQPTITTLAPGQSVHLYATALARDGRPVILPKQAKISWSVSTPKLGTISASGVLQTAKQPVVSKIPPNIETSGIVNATIAGVTGQSSVNVGDSRTTLLPMTTRSKWMLSTKADGTLTQSTFAPTTAGAGSLRVNYDYPAGKGSQQVVFWPKSTVTLPRAQNGDNPASVGMWVYGNNSSVSLAMSFTTPNNGTSTLYPTLTNFSGWRYVTAALPPQVVAGSTVNFLDFLVSNPLTSMSGTLYVSKLQVLYPPQSVPAANAVSKAPWFYPVKSPKQFSGVGQTVILTGGATVAPAKSDPGVTALNRLTQSLKSSFPTKSSRKGLWVQTLGNMVMNASKQDFLKLRALYKQMGIPVKSAVGARETSGSAENQGYYAMLGPTHYAYEKGNTKFIVLDDSQGGIQSSDPYQNPKGAQFPWLIAQLRTSHSKTVVIVANEAPYSQTPGDDTPFIDGIDAQVVETLASEYQTSHPGSHVVIVSLGTNGMAGRILSESGEDIAATGTLNAYGISPVAGVENVYAPPLISASSTGGQYLILHITTQGRVEWSTQPLLSPPPAKTKRSAHFANGK